MSLYDFDINKDWTDEKNKAAARGDIPAAEQAERNHNKKIDILGLNLPKTYEYASISEELEADMRNGKPPQAVFQKAMLRQNKSLTTPGLSQYAYDDIQRRAMQYYADGMSPRPTYENKRQTTVDDLWERVVNAPEFSYNAESDPVYQSYKDMYTREGQRAMQDTLAALSIDAGGENSWAVSAAAQAQNRYMQELADKVPELYNLAYDRYMSERNADMNKLALARDMENTDYGRYIDAMDIYQTDRGYYDTQMDKWNAEAEAYKTDAENKVWTLVQAGETPSDELLAAAGITDKEQIKNIAGVNKSMIGYELAGMGIEQKMNELALQEALGQLGGNNYRYAGPAQPQLPGGNPTKNINEAMIANNATLQMRGLGDKSYEEIEKMVEEGKLIAEEVNGRIVFKWPYEVNSPDKYLIK